jgi:hypothetical protein
MEHDDRPRDRPDGGRHRAPQHFPAYPPPPGDEWDAPAHSNEPTVNLAGKRPPPWPPGQFTEIHRPDYRPRHLGRWRRLLSRLVRRLHR